LLCTIKLSHASRKPAEVLPDEFISTIAATRSGHGADVRHEYSPGEPTAGADVEVRTRTRRFHKRPTGSVASFCWATQTEDFLGHPHARESRARSSAWAGWGAHGTLTDLSQRKSSQSSRVPYSADVGAGRVSTSAGASYIARY
jgi:hypothetical protein